VSNHFLQIFSLTNAFEFCSAELCSTNLALGELRPTKTVYVRGICSSKTANIGLIRDGAVTSSSEGLSGVGQERYVRKNLPGQGSSDQGKKKE
jgi:hypothetical protein